jgi:hypothetical protein
MVTLLKQHPDYTSALKHADATNRTGAVDLAPLNQVVLDCLNQQLASSVPAPGL